MSSVKITDYAATVEEMRAVFNTGRTKTKQWRKSQLEAVITCLTEQKVSLARALNQDLNKDEYDSVVDEISFCVNEARWFLDNLDYLMKDKKLSVDLLNIGSTAYVHHEPLGVVLNITAWNYPVQLIFSLLINIVSAGNCLVMKPSEISSNTSRLVARLIPQYFDQQCIKVIEGAIPETTALLKVKWDHIVYTGNEFVGKIVYKAAAEHITPCTLELGGKCPSYISAGCDMEAVCNRICWTKFKNAGQTCITVDYILVDESVEAAFVEQMIKTVREQYTEDPSTCDSYCRIVSERHQQRLVKLLESSTGVVRLGGESDKENRYIAPTLLTNISPNDMIMKEEIFGPLLPVLKVKDHREAIEFINARPKPLHINVFSNDKPIIDEFISRTSSGGFSSNDCIIFKIERGLPFGGVGNSGFGAYGGYAGFTNFSHKKSVLLKSLGMEWLNKLMRYAPHTPTKQRRVQFIQELPGRLLRWSKAISAFTLAAAIVGLSMYLRLQQEQDKK